MPERIQGLLLSQADCAAIWPLLVAGNTALRTRGSVTKRAMDVAVAIGDARVPLPDFQHGNESISGPEIEEEWVSAEQVVRQLGRGMGERRVRQLIRESGVPIRYGSNGKLLCPAGTVEIIRERRADS